MRWMFINVVVGRDERLEWVYGAGMVRGRGGFVWRDRVYSWEEIREMMRCTYFRVREDRKRVHIWVNLYLVGLLVVFDGGTVHEVLFEMVGAVLDGWMRMRIQNGVQALVREPMGLSVQDVFYFLYFVNF